MSDAIWTFLSTEDFQPHGYCLMWRPGVFWLHIVADSLIALSYFSIPAAIVFFARRRKDLSYRWVLYLFGAFIVSCGVSHLFGIWTMWVPDYGVQGLLKLVTAIISVVTAVALWPLMPRLLAIPSRRQLEAANAELRNEVSERRRAQAQLEAAKDELEQALRDDLTGLPGRSLLSCVWQAARARAGRAGAQVGVLMIDLDGFKGINDRFGHLAGDAALVAVSNRLERCVRRSDCVSRLGGDEFVVLVESVQDSEQATSIAAVLTRAIQEPINLGSHLVSVGASIGVTTTDPACEESLEDALSRADREMYICKKSSKKINYLKKIM